MSPLQSFRSFVATYSLITVLLLLLVAGGGFVAGKWLTGQGDALCEAVDRITAVLIQQVQDDIQASVTFLAENPEGIPGIPPELIRQGIERDEATILRLRALGC